MNEYIYSIVCLSTAVGMVSVLCPEESRQGIKKYVRLIGAVCLLCALIKPVSELLDAIKKFDADELSNMIQPEGEVYDKYESIYQNYLDGHYGNNIGQAVKDCLFEKFDINNEDCRVNTEFEDINGDGVREPKKITVILSGRAKFNDPDAISKLVLNVFGCACVVAIE